MSTLITSFAKCPKKILNSHSTPVLIKTKPYRNTVPSHEPREDKRPPLAALTKSPSSIPPSSSFPLPPHHLLPIQIPSTSLSRRRFPAPASLLPLPRRRRTSPSVCLDFRSSNDVVLEDPELAEELSNGSAREFGVEERTSPSVCLDIRSSNNAVSEAPELAEELFNGSTRELGAEELELLDKPLPSAKAAADDIVSEVSDSMDEHRQDLIPRNNVLKLKFGYGGQF